MQANFAGHILRPTNAYYDSSEPVRNLLNVSITGFGLSLSVGPPVPRYPGSGSLYASFDLVGLDPRSRGS
jgi:hypothetical protein